jgi:hypothetical protein
MYITVNNQRICCLYVFICIILVLTMAQLLFYVPLLLAGLTAEPCLEEELMILAGEARGRRCCLNCSSYSCSWYMRCSCSTRASLASSAMSACSRPHIHMNTYLLIHLISNEASDSNTYPEQTAIHKPSAVYLRQVTNGTLRAEVVDKFLVLTCPESASLALTVQPLGLQPKHSSPSSTPYNVQWYIAGHTG